MRNDGSYVLLDFAQVICSKLDDDKFPEIGIDHFGGNEASGLMTEVLMPLGIISLPVDAERSEGGAVGNACSALTLTEGDRVHTMPLTDPRVMPELPPVKPGAFIFFCPAQPKSFGVLDGIDTTGVNRPGSFTLSTRYGSKAHLFQLDVRKDGKEGVQLKHAEGMGLQMLSGGNRSFVMRNAAGNVFLELHDKGYTLAGKGKLQGSMNVGQMSAADALVKVKALAGWAAMIEGAISGLGGIIPVTFQAGMELLKTQHLKSS